MEGAIDDFITKLPPTIQGWERDSKHDIYTPDNLFEYINGGAELYISYGFKELLALRYKQGEDNEIKIDIFDMGRSVDAFGVFVHSAETPDDGIGQGSEYAAGLLNFWKDRYYVSILAYPETPAKRELVLDLGNRIAAAIHADGPLPPLLKRLPEENRIPHSTRYFHHYIWLNSHYFISDKNILHIDGNTDAVLAAYGERKNKYYLLLISYPGKEKAEAAHQSFLQHFLPDARNGIGQLEDKRWAGCKLENNTITVVFNAPNIETVKKYLNK